MTLRLYDTALRGVREFLPADPGNVTVYLCGAAVHRPPGIGQMRSAVCSDILIRWLETSGYKVTVCRSVPDVDDKVLNAARRQSLPWWQLAERNHRLLRDAFHLLGCRPPDAEPKAAGHVPQVIRLIARLVEKGHAYQASGNVYLALATDPAGHDAPSRRSRPQSHFTLWKAAKPGEPSWDAPWGPGRPGSDIACSAMATEYLGEGFDIHGGGLDPRAQSTSAGHTRARYCWRNATTGHAGAAGADLATVRPVELRYYLCQAQYRQVLEYSRDGLEEAAASYRRIERFITGARELLGGHEFAGLVLPVSFTAAMDSDLAVPCALASLHAAVHDGNNAIAGGEMRGVREILTIVRSMLTVLGLDPLDPHWLTGPRNDRLQTVVDGLVTLVIGQREKAREQRDYSTADSIRERLERIGVKVEDTVNGPRWELR